MPIKGTNLFEKASKSQRVCVGKPNGECRKVDVEQQLPV